MGGGVFMTTLHTYTRTLAHSHIHTLTHSLTHSHAGLSGVGTVCGRGLKCSGQLRCARTNAQHTTPYTHTDARTRSRARALIVFGFFKIGFGVRNTHARTHARTRAHMHTQPSPPLANTHMRAHTGVGI